MDDLTLKEYDWLMEAVRLREIDEEFKAHRQAFLNFQVQGTDRKGKPVYKRFDKFYDYKKALASIGRKKPHNDRFAALKRHIREGEVNG